MCRRDIDVMQENWREKKKKKNERITKIEWKHLLKFVLERRRRRRKNENTTEERWRTFQKVMVCDGIVPLSICTNI